MNVWSCSIEPFYHYSWYPDSVCSHAFKKDRCLMKHFSSLIDTVSRASIDVLWIHYQGQLQHEMPGISGSFGVHAGTLIRDLCCSSLQTKLLSGTFQLVLSGQEDGLSSYSTCFFLLVRWYWNTSSGARPSRKTWNPVPWLLTLG